jgi:rhodanese-related sulfurtransferase
MKRSVSVILATMLASSGGLLAACGSSNSTPSDVTADTSEQQGASAPLPDGATLIDVRMPDEYAAGHLEGAVNIPLEDGSLEAALGSFSAADRYVVYCRTGRRSEIAARLLTDAGLDRVTDLGGFDEAREATGLAVVVP